jgi:1-acyl-sn-glycerol-3-phosphate acyltransferase
VAEHVPYPSARQRAILMPVFRLLRAYYRARAHGLEDLPKGPPFLYVAKHPRCFLYFETMLLGIFTFFSDRDWPEIQVMEKRETSLHNTPLVGWLRRNVNTIPAVEDVAVQTLREGRSVLVFPGGARELHGEPDVLQWSGRRGFARIAARAGVPVVPLAIAGADRQHPWRLRIGKGNTLWLPPLPLPVRLDYWFGRPMAPPDPARPELLGTFADEVTAATQALLDRASR